MSEMYPAATSHAVTVAATGRPLDRAAACRQLRLDDITEENDQVDFLIDAVTAEVEDRYGLAMIQQTIAAKFSAFPCGGGRLRLPVGPVTEIDSVTYIDDNGAPQTWNGAQYAFATVDTYDYLFAKTTYEYPAGLATRPDAVTVTYKAGFGTTFAAVPANVKAGLMLAISNLYANPEDGVKSLPTRSDQIFRAYKRSFT